MEKINLKSTRSFEGLEIVLDFLHGKFFRNSKSKIFGNAEYNDATRTQKSISAETSDILIFASQILDAISSKNFETFNFSSSDNNDAGETVVPIFFSFFIKEVSFLSVESRARKPDSSRHLVSLRN